MHASDEYNRAGPGPGSRLGVVSVRPAMLIGVADIGRAVGLRVWLEGKGNMGWSSTESVRIAQSVNSSSRWAPRVRLSRQRRSHAYKGCVKIWSP